METSGDTLLGDWKTALRPHCEQPGPLQSSTSHGVPQLSPLHVPNQGVGFPRQCEVGRSRLSGGPS